MAIDPFVAITGIFVALQAVAIILGIALYIYMALAWSSIAKKLGRQDIHWLAWIPLANYALLPILAEKEWPWVFIFLVPIANIVFMIIWLWKIFERRKLPGALALIPIGAFIPLLNFLAMPALLVVFGIAAWKKD